MKCQNCGGRAMEKLDAYDKESDYLCNKCGSLWKIEYDS